LHAGGSRDIVAIVLRLGKVWEAVVAIRGFVAAGLMIAATSFAAGQATAQNNYGAIAYSPSTGAHGWSTDYPSRGEAETVALQNCGKHAGDCTVPIWFRNACGALAVGSGGYGSGWGTSRQLAENYARQTCRKFTGNCQIRRWVCTTR
jgi:hypothetical protein